MNIEDFAKRIARLDSRPYHPEDYTDDAAKLLDPHCVGRTTLDRRLSELEKPENKKLTNGYTALLWYLRDGILLDEYDGRVLLIVE